MDGRTDSPSSGDFCSCFWSIDGGTTGDRGTCLFRDGAGLTRTLTVWTPPSACARTDAFKGILVDSRAASLPRRKTTENIRYCSLIPFEKLCLTMCTEKSFECFLNYLFVFLFRRGDFQSSFVSCPTCTYVHLCTCTYLISLYAIVHFR